MDHLLRSETKLEVMTADHALTAVVEGAAHVLAGLSQYRKVIIKTARA
jgi:hypothetical protein